MSTYQEISSFIWRVCDDELRGLFKPHEYGDVILPFLVLRRLDCLLEPQKDKVVEEYNQRRPHEALQNQTPYEPKQQIVYLTYYFETVLQKGTYI